ncbi:MAG: hypothetical protein DMF65_03075 [Acidobacteria bacterium]|nr:MAG: hypothetical protein DMF65_03075 [Acidobacteriota bacterium]
MAHDVFISYAAEDKSIADAICQTLEAQGIGCWYAPRNVPYGVDFEEAIVEAIAASRFMVLIISAHSIKSRHVRREVQVASRQDAEVPIIPFRIQDVPLNNALTYYLSSIHWLDASTPPLETHLQRLVEHVHARLTTHMPNSSGAEAKDTTHTVVANPAPAEQATEAATDAVGQRQLTETQKLQLEYWLRFREYLRQHSSLLRLREPQPQYWMYVSSPEWPRGSLVALMYVRARRVTVALMLSGAQAKEHFRALLPEKETIEAEIGAPLDWQERPKQGVSQILLHRENANPQDRADWPAQHAWLRERLESFYRAFAPRIRNL